MIAETLVRLVEQCVPPFKLVSGAADFQRAAESNPTATPAVYVLPLAEQPGARPFSGNDIQKFDVSVSVVLVAKNAADPKGGAVLDDLQALRDAVKTALLGWTPREGYASLARGRAHLLAFKDGHLWWQDTYVSSFYERKP